MPFPLRRRRGRLATAVIAPLLAVPALVAMAAPAAAAPPGYDNRNNNTVEKLLECVTLDGVRAHQQALQSIASANGGTRASGTPGYDRSVDYVAGQMRAAGYKVTVQAFPFPFFSEDSAPALEQVSPDPTVYTTDPVNGFATMTYSGSGDVTATV